jgi:hypothetical protein
MGVSYEFIIDFCAMKSMGLGTIVSRVVYVRLRIYSGWAA